MSVQKINLLAHLSRWLRTLVPLLMIFALVQCGGSGGPGLGGPGGDLPIGVAPTFLIETATEGTLRAELEVYGPDGNLVHREDLRINPETGEIFSSQFTLDRGFTYTFLITFYFSQPGMAELPVAIVLKSLSTDDTFLSVNFDASEVLTSLSQINPDLSASVSQSILPELDADGDGFSNFAEVLEGSDPYDPTDYPQAPQMEGDPFFSSFDDMLEFTVVFTDTSGVESIKPVGDFVCGYREFTVTPLDAKGRRTELTVRFNLHSHDIADGETVNFAYEVTDKLGVSAVHSIAAPEVGVSASIPADLNRPEILVLTPEPGQSVSDFFSVEAVACHKNGVDSFIIDNIEGFVDQAGADKEIIFGTIPTNDLNANQVIHFLASAIGGFSNTKSVTVTVDDLNPIKIDAPTPGAILANGFTLVAHVDKNAMPDVTQFYIEKVTPDLEGNQTEIFSLNQLKFDVNSLPEAFTGQVFDVTQVSASKFYVHFVAIGPDSGRKERTVSYSLNVKPQIDEFDVYLDGPHACIAGRGIHVNWQVDNVDYIEVGNPVAQIGGEGAQIGNSFNLGLAIACSNTIPLEAFREVQEISGGSITLVSQQAELSLDQITISSLNGANTLRLLGDSLYQVQKSGTNSGNLNGFNWQVEIQEWDRAFNAPVAAPYTRTGAQIGDMGAISGADLAMHYWGAYKVVFKLMAPGGSGVVLSQSQAYQVIFHHPDIVGWWTMDNQFDFSDDSLGIQNGFSVGVALPNPLNCIVGNCGDFDGDDYIQVFDDALLDPTEDDFPGTAPSFNANNPESFTVEAWVNFGDVSVDRPIVVKQDQFQLIVKDDLGTKKLQFTLTDNQAMPNDHIAERAFAGLGTGWHHIVAIYDAGSGLIDLYVNASNTGITSGSTATIADGNGTDEDFYIGYNGELYFFDGLMDEVVFYSHGTSNPFGSGSPIQKIKQSCNFKSPGNCP